MKILQSLLATACCAGALCLNACNAQTEHQAVPEAPHFDASQYYVDDVGTKARFNGPTGLAFDKHGNLFVADTGNHVIRKITPTGVVSTVAGKVQEPGSVDGVGGDARFNHPLYISFDLTGNLLIPDGHNDTIRKMSPDGTVTTIAGKSGTRSSDMEKWKQHGDRDGSINDASFDLPWNVVSDSRGNIYVSTPVSIRRIDRDGQVKTVAGMIGTNSRSEKAPQCLDGLGTSMTIRTIGLAIDHENSIYFDDRARIVKLTEHGELTTIAGDCLNYGFRDGRGSQALFHSTRGIALDSKGNVYVNQAHTHTVRKIDKHGVVTTLAGSGVIEDYGNINGQGREARFTQLRGIAINAKGGIYVSDERNNNIRVIATDGRVTTFAGIDSNK